MSTPPINISDVLRELLSRVESYEQGHTDLQQQLFTAQAELDTRLKILERAALVSETDTRGVITYANDKFCEVSGYSREELIGKPHNIVRHPDMPREVFKEMWDTIKAGKIFQGEIKNRRKDGSPYWVIATVAPVLGAEGYPVKYVSVRFDITRQKLLEEALRQEREGLNQEIVQNMQVAREIQEALSGVATCSIPHFCINKPKHILSGDFYWMHEDKGRIIGMMGDSVGHGVAAGYVSALFLQELRHLVLDRGMWGPGMIAEELDARLGKVFSRQVRTVVSVDGVIFLIDLPRYTFTYTSFQGKGAWVRGGEVVSLDKVPFSFGDLLGKAAQETRIDLAKGDRLYFYSDGVLDQPTQTRPKWGSRAWLEYLRDLQNLPLEKQQEDLVRQIDGWIQEQGQNDDILILGIEIP